MIRESKRSRLRPIAVATMVALGGMSFVNALRADNANYTTLSAYTSAVITATNKFISTLTSTQVGTQQASCTMSGGGTLSYSYLVGLVECWSNLPGSRNGLKLGDLSTAQNNAALSLMSAALSTRGLTTVAEIRASDDVIDASTTNSPWGSAKYYMALYGVPSTSTPWQLQFSGHHLAMNINYSGAYTAPTPMFLGTEPPNWTDSSGTYHAPLDVQRSAFYNLAESLQASSTNKASATLSGTFTDVVMGIDTSAGCDSKYPATYPTGITGRGIAVSSLTSAQKTLVKNAIAAWTSLMPRVVATTLNTAYTSDTALAETYVGLGMGSSGKADFSPKPSGLTSQYSYMRIDGPRVWIEFAVQQGVAYPTQVHYHTIWRDKTADYGGNFSTGSAGTTGLCGASSSSSGTTTGGTPPSGGRPGA